MSSHHFILCSFSIAPERQFNVPEEETQVHISAESKLIVCSAVTTPSFIVIMREGHGSSTVPIIIKQYQDTESRSTQTERKQEFATNLYLITPNSSHMLPVCVGTQVVLCIRDEQTGISGVEIAKTVMISIAACTIILEYRALNSRSGAF